MNQNANEHVDLMNLRVKCVALLLDCPLHRTEATCPFSRVREKSVLTRVNWLKSLDGARIMRLLAQHAKCISEPGIPEPSRDGSV